MMVNVRKKTNLRTHASREAQLREVKEIYARGMPISKAPENRPTEHPNKQFLKSKYKQER